MGSVDGETDRQGNDMLSNAVVAAVVAVFTVYLGNLYEIGLLRQLVIAVVIVLLLSSFLDQWF